MVIDHYAYTTSTLAVEKKWEPEQRNDVFEASCANPLLHGTAAIANCSKIITTAKEDGGELIYPRNISVGACTTVPNPSYFGITDFEDLRLPTPNSETLYAYLIRPPNKYAGNIGHRLPIACVLSNELGSNVLMLQYRGYGL
ncbi:bem46 protein, variant [Zalaria obscura]|uniref:Bem46 protein, variant n=1 Tax=Zalaria obscura TaxID=2024903 RepID=A0ACC3SK92_9PEZI